MTAENSNTTSFVSAIPILNVEGVGASIEHYTSVLGFTKDWDWPDEEADKTFASISNGHAHLFLAKDSQGARPTFIYYEVGDVDRLHEEYQKAGATIRQAPEDMPWGMREMLIADLDGHILRIGGSTEGHE